jgi:hypothetical protein
VSALLLGKKPLVPVKLEAGWVLELVWVFGEGIDVLLLLRYEPQIFQSMV